jgi:hypothetical protein
MADNDMSNFLDTAETKEPVKRQRRKRGAGDIVCITLRLSHAQWRSAHSLALSEGMSINQLAINGINLILKEKGLRPLGD